jgi:type VI secretion system secreted protein VgrG
MPSPKSGSAGSAVSPADPTKAAEADKADPGEVEKAKAEQRQTKTGKYGTAKVPVHKPPKEEDRKKKTGWIEIELVDENGMPAAGQGYRVTLPDGSVATGTLDPDGFARVEGFEPGNCKVTFPELDQRDWKQT